MLLTVVWIAVIGWLGYQRVVERYDPVGQSRVVVFSPHPFLELKSGDVSSECPSFDPVRHELHTEGMPEAGPMTLLVFCEREDRPSWANQFTNADELVKAVRAQVERHDTDELLMVGSFVLTLAFPFGILLVVLLLRWVARGFRRAA